MNVINVKNDKLIDTKIILWSIVPFCSNPETSPDISNSECMSISVWRALGWESEDGVVLMLLAKSATGLEKNFELPGVRTAFSSEVKPKDNGPVDLFKWKNKNHQFANFGQLYDISYLIIWWGGVRLTFRFHDCIPDCLDDSPAPSRRSVPNKPLVLSTWSMWTFNNSVYLSWTFVNSFLISFSFSSRRNTVENKIEKCV